MKKFTFLLGASVGFVMGSRAGSGPYQQLESKVRDVAARREVQSAVDQAKSVAKDEVSSITDKLASSQGRSIDDSGPAVTADSPVQSYADPQDLQFSKAAAEKEQMVDGLLAGGLPPEDLPEKEEELRQHGELNEPRAGNKPKSP